MTNETPQQDTRWRKPELKRVGSISDVAGRPVPVDQDALNRKS
ncbi:MAG: hypothetical protein R3D99_01510 [Altererythrobacter sp.]